MSQTNNPYAGTRQGAGQYQIYTGLDNFQFLGVNPDKTTLEKWQGREISFDPSYDVVQDQNGNNQRPLHIWLKGDVVGVQRFILNIGNTPAIASGGNYQIITSTGNITWAKSKKTEDNPNPEVKPQFADHKPLVAGEAALITFVQKLVSFDTRLGEDFYTQMQQLKQDAQSVYNGDYSGLNKLAVDMDGTYVVFPMVVKDKDVAGSDGTVTTKQQMSIGASQYNLDKVMFNGKVSDYVKGRFKENLDKDANLLKGMYTVDLVPFNRDTVLNNVPNNPTTTVEWNS